ncbi:hypothetical protein CI109_100115 [Kwoniella shandongensis]|uniref:Uncharacterized protein n=1 Tax=Kwoniella shandongensis TaxID=1734106 RepID=A0A5M6BPK3_9TREE|nr:uncharacterized protein CI109_006857 [Kwoniella shandongensis]KAA5524834.1 hypothetical protein CI109_006857 [Kwoniella shandongensis]
MSTSSTSNLASTRLCENADILQSIFSYLSDSPGTLFSCLLVCRSFFHPSASVLYRTISIGSDSSSSSSGSSGRNRDIFIGSTRPGSYSYSSLGDEYCKNTLLSYVRECTISIHGINECPFVQHYIQPLPHLHTLYLAGGRRPKNLDREDICSDDKCQFVQKVCHLSTKKVIIRQLDISKVLSRMEAVEEVVWKLRPCQLPLFLALVDDDEDGEKYQWPYQFENNISPTIRSLRLVWWDERHSFRIEGYQSTPSDQTRWSRYGQFGPIQMKGCTYCDQAGCVRYSPHAAVQLPALMSKLGEETEIGKVEVYNVEKTAGEQWFNGRIGVEEVKERMERAFLEGRTRRRNREKRQLANNNDIEQGQFRFTTIVDDHDAVTFHSAEEYFSSHRDEIDAPELPYWQNKIGPSERWLKLRDEAIEVTGHAEGDKEYFGDWSAEELREHIARMRFFNERDRLESQREAEAQTVVGL